jgi:hypothetical protein
MAGSMAAALLSSGTDLKTIDPEVSQGCYVQAAMRLPPYTVWYSPDVNWSVLHGFVPVVCAKAGLSCCQWPGPRRS